MGEVQLVNLFNYQEIIKRKNDLGNLEENVLLYTSYHAVSKDGDIVVSSSKPRWKSNLKTIHYKLLNPFNIIKGKNPLELTNEEYIPRFLEGLSKLNAKDVYAELKYLAKGDIPTIVCYEKPTDMCHRHIVAQWLSDELGIIFQEKNVLNKKFNKDKFCYL